MSLPWIQTQALTPAEQIPPAPDAGRRHPHSDPAETYSRPIRRACQYCMRHEEDGMTLRRCGACKVDRYCDKRCQKAAWPVHKNVCKLNREAHASFEAVPGGLERFEALRSFTNKHHATIAAASFQSIRYYYLPPSSLDPIATSKQREDVLVVDLRTRPNAQHARPEKYFYVTDARLETISTFFPEEKCEDMRVRLRNSREAATRHRGPSCACFVVLTLLDPATGLAPANILPFGFSLDPNASAGLPDIPSKGFLMYMLNEGIVR